MAATIAGVVCCAWAAPAGAHVYWANNDLFSGTTLGRADLDGSGVNQGFITGANAPAGVAVDAQHVYWTNANMGTIGRANLDGSGANQSFITGADAPVGVAVDAQHVYWTNMNTGTIGRANLDGSGAAQRFITGANGPYGLAVDGRHVYWTNDATFMIGRANLDGSGADQRFIDGDGSDLLGVAVDGQHLYWTNAGRETIGRANLDGSDPDQSFITGAGSPYAVAVDGQHVYWTDYPGTIGRANLDGSGANQSFISGAIDPFGVAVDGGPAGSAWASARSLSFGAQPLGVLGAPKALTITNSGHGNLQIETARIAGGAGGDFLISSDTCSHTSLNIGAACTIQVRFDARATGARRAVLALTSNDPASPLQIELTGTGWSGPFV